MNDDDLRARLRAADPARHLTGSWQLELTEVGMNTPDTSGSSRNRVALVAAAAAIVVLAGIGAFAITGDDDPANQTAGEQTTGQDGQTGAPDATTATYTLPAAAPQARCMPPNPAGIEKLDAAFQGTVVSTGEQQVVLAPSEYYTGDEADQVVLTYDPDEVISELLPVDFQEGKDYIVAVKDGQVQLCGYTAPARAQLDATYRRVLEE